MSLRIASLNVRWFVILALVPVAVVGLLAAYVQVEALFRYDPAYFAPPYQEQYSTPAAVLDNLMRGIHSGNQALLSELQGLQRPSTFKQVPAIVFVMGYDRDDDYRHYLFMDAQTYGRYTFAMEFVGGRWVLAPPDLRYLFYSGQWLDVFSPVIAFWWLVELAGAFSLWLYRYGQRQRAAVFGWRS